MKVGLGLGASTGKPRAQRVAAGAPFPEAIHQEVATAVELLASRLDADAPARFRPAASAMADLIRRNGKRVRPSLCLLGYEAADGPRLTRDGVTTFAAGLELLHAFLLVHDDIADRADSRRGGPAVHVALRPRVGALPEDERQRLGEQLALVGGDWLYTRALTTMLEAPVAPDARARALARVLDVCRATAEGQYADIELSARPLTTVSTDEVVEIYRLKTGRYTFEAPLVSGAMLAGASEAICAALTDCARHLGIAFQIQDDLFGIFASECETGKPSLADLREAKKTWLLLTACESAPGTERRWLEELLARRAATVADLSRVRGLVIESGAFNRAVQEIERRCEAARAALAVTRARSVAMALDPLINWIEARVTPRLQEAA